MCYEGTRDERFVYVILRGILSLLTISWLAVRLESIIIHESSLITGGRSSNGNDRKWDEKYVQGYAYWLRQPIFLILIFSHSANESNLDYLSILQSLAPWAATHPCDDFSMWVTRKVRTASCDCWTLNEVDKICPASSKQVILHPVVLCPSILPRLSIMGSCHRHLLLFLSSSLIEDGDDDDGSVILPRTQEEQVFHAHRMRTFNSKYHFIYFIYLEAMFSHQISSRIVVNEFQHHPRKQKKDVCKKKSTMNVDHYEWN